MLLLIWEIVRADEKGFCSSTTEFACEEWRLGALERLTEGGGRTRLSVTPVEARTVRFAYESSFDERLKTGQRGGG